MLLTLIISTQEVMSVCLLATSHKNYWTDLRENFTTYVSVYKEELFRFWKPSVFGSGSSNFSNDSSTFRDGAFFKIWLMSLEKLIGSTLKFCHKRFFGQGSISNASHYQFFKCHCVWITALTTVLLPLKMWIVAYAIQPVTGSQSVRNPQNMMMSANSPEDLSWCICSEK